MKNCCVFWYGYRVLSFPLEKLLHTKTPRAAPTLTVPHEFHFHTEKRAHIHKETGQCSLEAQVHRISWTAANQFAIAAKVMSYLLCFMNACRLKAQACLTYLLQKWYKNFRWIFWVNSEHKYVSAFVGVNHAVECIARLLLIELLCFMFIRGFFMCIFAVVGLRL